MLTQRGKKIAEQRLIDANAFKKYIRNAYEETKNLYTDNGEWAKEITESFCQDINEQPTIEERKKGKWIKDRLLSTNTSFGGTYGVRRCSECESYYQDVGYGWNFCPNCGADMREET